MNLFDIAEKNFNEIQYKIQQEFPFLNLKLVKENKKIVLKKDRKSICAIIGNDVKQYELSNILCITMNKYQVVDFFTEYVKSLDNNLHNEIGVVLYKKMKHNGKVKTLYLKCSDLNDMSFVTNINHATVFTSDNEAKYFSDLLKLKYEYI